VEWLDVWVRAVVVPAGRRAGGVWAGCVLVAAMTFGGNGLYPSDVTALALAHGGVAVTLGLTWLLVFAPTARLLVRAEPAAYLRSLPGPTVAPRVITVGALVVLQLPWLLLWVVGDGWRGLAIVAALTLVIVALASWRPRPLRAGWPRWRTSGAALRSIHVRALRRRAGDALVRGAGLAILAGAAGGLFVRNNGLVGPSAGAVGGSVIAVVLVPAAVGVLLVVLATHRQSAWLAAALGISHGVRIGAVVYAILVVQIGATAISIAAAAIVADTDFESTLWVAGTSLAIALGAALGQARVLLGGQESPSVASRVVVGSTAVAALAVVCVGALGALGALAYIACGALVLARGSA
jgi:hypothetical protein